jgi:hypothetical protein
MISCVVRVEAGEEGWNSGFDLILFGFARSVPNSVCGFLEGIVGLDVFKYILEVSDHPVAFRRKLMFLV